MLTYGGVGGGTYGGAGSVITGTFSGTGALTGGTIFGSNVPATSAGGIPLISLSSGSVSAAGAISAITALPAVYPAAYCYFPANALATAIAAGWYYCTFTTTTAGTAFLNTYTSGMAAIPASPTAVTDGKGAFTGDTSTETAYQFTIAANAMGATGVIRFRMATQQANNANAKTINVRIGTTAFGVCSVANVSAGGIEGEIANTGATNAQLSSFAPFWVNPSTFSALGTVDTTSAQALNVTVVKATATDNVVLLPPTATLIRSQ